MNKIVKAYIHEGLDKLEDPVILVKQYIRDMQEDMKQLDEMIEKHRKLDRSLQKDALLAKQLADRREEQARLAIEKGNEELARMALVNKREALVQMERYEQLREKNNVLMNDRMKQLEEMQQKYRQLRDRKLELILRVQAVKANEQMRKMKEKYAHHHSAIERDFERMEDRVGELEWKVQESDDFLYSKEKGYSAEIEEELKRLKEEK